MDGGTSLFVFQSINLLLCIYRMFEFRKKQPWLYRLTGPLTVERGTR
jgi:hypothetical protein